MRRTSTCTICGQPAARGAALCAPCRAALKRAGQRTVQELPHYRHPVPRARARRREPVASTADGAATAPRASRRRSGDTGRRVVLATAAVAALAGVAYLGQAQWRPGDDDVPGETRTFPAPAKPAPQASPASTAPALAATPVVAPAAVRAAPPAASDAARAPPASRRAATPSPPAATPTATTAYPSLDAFGAIAEAPRVPPPPPQVAATRPPPPPDRWQRMRDALAQCEREGGFEGFLCDQRTRIDACEGYWGRVPQCPDMPENPR